MPLSVARSVWLSEAQVYMIDSSPSGRSARTSVEASLKPRLLDEKTCPPGRLNGHPRMS